MNAVELLHLIAQGESAHVEFKSSFQKDAIETLTAFANTQGGAVIEFRGATKTGGYLLKEGSELATNCSQLKMESTDGKNYLTEVADTEQLLRVIQSIKVTHHATHRI